MQTWRLLHEPPIKHTGYSVGHTMLYPFFIYIILVVLVPVDIISYTTTSHRTNKTKMVGSVLPHTPILSRLMGIYISWPI